MFFFNDALIQIWKTFERTRKIFSPSNFSTISTFVKFILSKFAEFVKNGLRIDFVRNFFWARLTVNQKCGDI